MFKYSEDTCKILHKIISCVLPKEGKDTKDIEELTKKLLTLVDKQETNGFYYVILDIFSRISRIKSFSPHTEIVVSRGTFSASLQVNINRYLKSRDVGLETLLSEYDVDANLNTPDGQLIAKSFFYDYCMKMYDNCVNTDIDMVEGFTLLESLYQCILDDLSLTTLHTSARILENGVMIKGKEYKNGEGYFEHIREVLSLKSDQEVKWEHNRESIYIINSIEDYNNLNNQSRLSLYPIGKFNVQPFDEKTHITSGDIISIIGDEGTGKTNYLVMQSVDQIVQGHSIIFMCGESHPAKIINMMLSRFIFLETGNKIGWKEIQSTLHELPEEMQAVVNHCKNKLFNSEEFGKFQLVKSFHYDNVKHEILDIITANRQNKYTMVYIDHADRLNQERTNLNIFLRDAHSRVSYLYDMLIDLSVEYGIGSTVAVHTGSEAAKAVARGKDAGKRIGATSSATTKDVDIAIHLESGPSLEGKGLVKVRPLKFREYDISKLKPVILKRDFICVNYIYAEEFQVELGEEEGEAIRLEGLDIDELIGS